MAETHSRNVVRLPPVLELADRLSRRTLHPFKEFFIKLEARTKAAVPLMGTSVPAGFPSPADDYLDRPLDFNELLNKNPPATYAARVDGDSMIGVGIFPGDIVVVDRSVPVRDGAIILANVDGRITIKRFRSQNGRVWLHAENPAYPDIPISEGMTLEVWGVIDNSIRRLSTK